MIHSDRITALAESWEREAMVALGQSRVDDYAQRCLDTALALRQLEGLTRGIAESLARIEATLQQRVYTK